MCNSYIIYIYIYIYIKHKMVMTGRRQIFFRDTYKLSWILKGLYKCIFCQNSFACIRNMYIFASKVHL